jgi:hypothetical protein
MQAYFDPEDSAKLDLSVHVLCSSSRSLECPLENRRSTLQYTPNLVYVRANRIRHAQAVTGITALSDVRHSF